MTLFEKIGGEPAVRLAVEQFYVRVLGDPLLAPFFEKADLVRLKSHQFAFLSQVMGGPRKYSGAAMAQAHSRLRIEERHFNAVAGHLVETLRGLGVGEDIIGEVVAALTPLAADIVNTGAAGA
jgi:hemoglobin